jgi:hypothetical protein
MALLSTWRDLDPAERRAQLRALQAIVRLIVGPAAASLVTALRQAEADSAALPAVDLELNALPTIPRRRILCTFAATLPGAEGPVLGITFIAPPPLCGCDW